MGGFDLMDFIGFNFVFGSSDKSKSKPTPPAPPTQEKPKK